MYIHIIRAFLTSTLMKNNGLGVSHTQQNNLNTLTVLTNYFDRTSNQFNYHHILKDKFIVNTFLPLNTIAEWVFVPTTQLSPGV